MEFCWLYTGEETGLALQVDQILAIIHLIRYTRQNLRVGHLANSRSNRSIHSMPSLANIESNGDLFDSTPFHSNHKSVRTIRKISRWFTLGFWRVRTARCLLSDCGNRPKGTSKSPRDLPWQMKISFWGRGCWGPMETREGSLIRKTQAGRFLVATLAEPGQLDNHFRQR